MNLRKDWRVWCNNEYTPWAAPLGFFVAWTLSYLMFKQVLWLVLAGFMLLETFSGYLLYRQRKTIRRLYNTLERQTHAMGAASDTIGMLLVKLASSDLNLSRARAELQHAGIEFQLLTPPTAADKETLS